MSAETQVLLVAPEDLGLQDVGVLGEEIVEIDHLGNLRRAGGEKNLVFSTVTDDKKESTLIGLGTVGQEGLDSGIDFFFH